MRYTWLTLLALITGLLIFAGAAQAQYDSSDFYGASERYRWNVHAGAGFFIGDSKNSVTWIAGAEYEYPLAGQYFGPNSFLTIGADYYPVETEADETESVVPALVGFRKYGVLGSYNVFFGAGVGARWASGDIPELEIDEGVDFEWGLNAGVDITPRILGQIRFLAGTHPSDDSLVTVELGYRF